MPAAVPTLDIELPKPHAAQQKILAEALRFNVLCCGRRFGKSLLGIDRLVNMAINKQPAAWFAPTYKLLAPVWRDTKAILEPITVKKDEQEHRLELVGGGSIDMWTLDGNFVTRGRAYARVVLDEAAIIPDLLNVWDTAIRPTLADRRGDAWFLSTPRGMNDFQTLYQRGQADRPDWASWQMPTSSNPVIPKDEIEAARLDIAEGAFNQEFLAQFVAWEGAVFRRIMEAATAHEQDAPTPGHLYVIGVDWGKSRDYTVFMVIDITAKAVVHMDRSNTVDYAIQRGRLGVLNETWKPIKIIVESNSIGVPIIEQLQREGLPVQPFHTSNATKAAAVDALALAFERGDIKILDNPVLLGELQAFQSKPTPSGLTQYAAPEGQHDDTVIALALSWQGIAEHRRFPEFNLGLHVVAA